MPVPRITIHRIFEDGSFVVMARILGNDGNNITQANVSSIAGHIYDLHTDSPGSSDLWNGTLVVANTVFDTLQTTADDPRWTKDTTGYNFRSTVPASAVADSTRYRCEIVFTPSSGDDFILAFNLDAQTIYSS